MKSDHDLRRESLIIVQLDEIPSALRAMTSDAIDDHDPPRPRRISRIIRVARS